GVEVHVSRRRGTGQRRENEQRAEETPHGLLLDGGRLLVRGLASQLQQLAGGRQVGEHLSGLLRVVGVQGLALLTRALGEVRSRERRLLQQLRFAALGGGR